MWKWNRIHLFGIRLPQTVRFQCYLHKINNHKPSGTCSVLPHNSASNRHTYVKGNVEHIHNDSFYSHVSTIAREYQEKTIYESIACTFFLFVSNVCSFDCAIQYKNRNVCEGGMDNENSRWHEKKMEFLWQRKICSADY